MALYDPTELGRSPLGPGCRGFAVEPVPVSPVPASIPNADFTVADVLAWARTKPADEEYDYCDSGNCAVAQFVRETARGAKPAVSMNTWRAEGVARREFDMCIKEAVHDVNGLLEVGAQDWTFGGLVKRLEALS